MSFNTLDSIERSMTLRIAEVLKGRIGKKNSITNRSLQDAFPELSERSIQAIINHLRNSDMVPCLIASSRGYYIAENEAELLEYEKSLTNRIGELVKVREKISEQRARTYSQPYQARLF